MSSRLLKSFDDKYHACSALPGSQPIAGGQLRIFKIALLVFILFQQGNAVGENRPAIQSETLLQSSSSWDGKPYTAYRQAGRSFRF